MLPTMSKLYEKALQGLYKQTYRIQHTIIFCLYTKNCFCRVKNNLTANTENLSNPSMIYSIDNNYKSYCIIYEFVKDIIDSVLPSTLIYKLEQIRFYRSSIKLYKIIFTKDNAICISISQNLNNTVCTISSKLQIVKYRVPQD